MSVQFDMGRVRGRAALAVGAVTLTAACSAAVAQVHQAASGNTAAAVSPSTASPSSQPSLAVARVTEIFRVAASESYPAVKQQAARAVLALTDYSAHDTRATVAARVTSSSAQRSALETAAAPLFHAGASSTGTIVYPQMGGYAGGQASVMVVVRQTVTPVHGAMFTQTRTLDVRLARIGSAWRFVELASAGGEPPAPHHALSAVEARVLNDRRITLSDTARWDIMRGSISPTLLALMERIAARAPYAVTVLETGHPHDVFGTTHESLHAAGRALDINFFDGRHVIDQRGAGSPAYELVRWLLTQPEVSQVGSPWVLGPQPRSFTNGVHLDHIHVST